MADKISARVGKGGLKRGSSVSALQRLLAAAGQKVSVDGIWGSNTEEALTEFQKPLGQAKPPVEVRPYIDPGDNCFLWLCHKAQILLILPGVGGARGFTTMHNWLENRNARYDSAWNRAIFPIKNWRRVAYQTIGTRFAPGPIKMDCTTYANLMLAIWLNGDLKSGKHPYSPKCKKVGATSSFHLGRDRYGMSHVTLNGDGVIRSADQLATATHSPSSSLYLLEVAANYTAKGKYYAGGVKHLALLYNGNVYEANKAPGYNKIDGCFSTDLETFMNWRADKGQFLYVFGPI